MQTAMESIKSIVDVNTILGDPVETPDGSVVVPVSRISLGFAAGGTEYETGGKPGGGAEFPFGGGSGAGISVNPVAFLVVGQGEVRLLPVDSNVIFDRLIDWRLVWLTNCALLLCRERVTASTTRRWTRKWIPRRRNRCGASLVRSFPPVLFLI